MKNLLLKSRLLRNAEANGDCLEQDFSSQYDEFVELTNDVLFSDLGYLAIDETLHEALGLLDECLRGKKDNLYLGI